jgi:hypothetical protein
VHGPKCGYTQAGERSRVTIGADTSVFYDDEMGTKNRKDTQLVELAGRNRLAGELQRAGIEVARPERDRGVDLLAYLDLEKAFHARPIQMKASTGETFNVFPRYEKFPDLMLVYVWNVGQDKSRYFALTYDDAKSIAEKMGWTETRSWKGETAGPPGYIATTMTPPLRDLLVSHEITDPRQWRKKLFSL